MKTNILILCLCVLSLPLLAQTGILGLNYGQNRAETTAMLTELGFKQSDSDTKIFYGNDDSAIEEIELFYIPGDLRLVAWLTTYDVSEYEESDFQDYIHGELSELHGPYDDYEEYYGKTLWDLDENHYVFTSFDEDLISYFIYYGDNRHEEFFPFE